MLPDNPVPGNAPTGTGAGTQRLPADVVPPEISLRRSRIGWQVPVLGLPVLLALSAVLATTKATPPGIGVIVFFWGMVQAVWIGGPTRRNCRAFPHLDRQQMLLTGRNWTGQRTLNLAQLSRVRRVKWTFSGQYGTIRRVDYFVLTDRAGVRLSMPYHAAIGPVQCALDYQRKHGLAEARLSRFATMGLRLAPADAGFRIARTLVIFAGIAGYVAVVGSLIVWAIPTLAGYHGG